MLGKASTAAEHLLCFVLGCPSGAVVAVLLRLGVTGHCCSLTVGTPGWRDFPKAPLCTWGTAMSNPQDFLNPVELSPCLISFSFTLPIQKDFVPLHNLILANTHDFKSSHFSEETTALGIVLQPGFWCTVCLYFSLSLSQTEELLMKSMN